MGNVWLAHTAKFNVYISHKIVANVQAQEETTEQMIRTDKQEDADRTANSMVVNL